MSEPILFYTKKNSKILSLVVTQNSTGQFVDDMSLVATLNDPSGNPVPGATSITLTHVGPGLYQGAIAANFAPPVYGPGYITIFDGESAEGSVLHKETPSVVIVNQ